MDIGINSDARCVCTTVYVCTHIAGERKYRRGRNERERKKEMKERERGVSSNASIHVLTISDVSNSSISSDSPSWFKGVERARRVPLEVVNGL